MLHDPSYLILSHELLKAKVEWKLTPGGRISRGFADAGFEEYSVLTDKSMISLNTGKAGEIPETYKEHFFPVYTVDEMVPLLYSRGVDIVSLHFVEQRTWRLITTKDGKESGHEARTLEEVFLTRLLLDIKGE